MPGNIMAYRARIILTSPKLSHGGDPDSSTVGSPFSSWNAGRNRNFERLANAHVGKCRNPLGTACQGPSTWMVTERPQWDRKPEEARVFLAIPRICGDGDG